MELHHIRYFLAVAETGSFTRAATRCHVAQPSLSQQIINLEAELGQKLFDRLGRRASLTEAGRLFLARAQRIQLEVDNARKELSDEPDPLVGRVSIGAIPTIAPYLLPEFLDRCRTLFPKLEIHTYEDFMLYLLDAVREGEIDFALVGMPVEDAQLHAEPLFDDPLLLVLPLGHPLERKPRVEPADLVNEPLILLGEKSTVADQIERFFGRHTLHPRAVHRCAQVQTMKEFVAAGLGVAILPQLVRSLPDKRRLVYRQLASSAPQRPVSLVWDRRRYLSHGARQLVALLQELTRRRPKPAD